MPCCGLHPRLTPGKGRVTSFYGPSLERYTSYRAHTADEGAVKQFLFTEKGVISVSRQSVHYALRRGLTQWHLTYVLGCFH
jgi:PAB-dependent poly(A)-specific ribonuclease subunit 2